MSDSAAFCRLISRLDKIKINSLHRAEPRRVAHILLLCKPLIPSPLFIPRTANKLASPLMLSPPFTVDPAPEQGTDKCGAVVNWNAVDGPDPNLAIYKLC